VITETTEGLTRRTSSGSDSSAAEADAAKAKRASSASHGGSLRFIFRAFFSKRIDRALTCSALSGGVFKRRNPARILAAPTASGGHRRPKGNYDGIFGEVKYFMTELCRADFCERGRIRTARLPLAILRGSSPTVR